MVPWKYGEASAEGKAASAQGSTLECQRFLEAGRSSVVGSSESSRAQQPEPVCARWRVCCKEQKAFFP